MVTRRIIVGFILLSLAASVGMGLYVKSLYSQLMQNFALKNQFIPTRIYSDLNRIAPPHPLSHIRERLKTLGYAFQTSGNQVSFTLHSIDYPNYLIPEGHPTLNFGNKLITLNFDGSTEDSLLQSIVVDHNQEIPDLYLEPELVATLSQGAGAGQIRELVPFSAIPAYVWKAVIAIEDQHFLEHSGFDPRGLLRAVFVDLKTFSFAQGGSTITQQLVKNLMARRTKNIIRKISELFLSLLLEAKFEKEQILERYLNEVYLGQVGSLEVHGVSEGAKHFFGKRIEELNLGEIALMAGLIRGPGFYSPYRNWNRAHERQQLVLRKMVETGQIAEQEAAAALKLPVRLAPPQLNTNKAPYFTDFVKAELIRQLKDRMNEEEIIHAGFRVYTTLDMTMSVAAQQTLSQGIAALEKRFKLTQSATPPPKAAGATAKQQPQVIPANSHINHLEGALASVEHSSGYIRALVGGRSYAESTFNRILNMKRQVGSTFKPIVYLSALLKKEDQNGVAYGPAYPIEDAPWTLYYDRDKQKWSPKNYEKEYKGWISMRQALAQSINTAVAKIGFQVGVDQIVTTAHTLGIESELPKVPSLALGVAELSPIELLRAYATFANHGVQEELTVIRCITQDNGSDYARFVHHPNRIFDVGPMDLLTDMLQSVFTEGTAQSASQLGLDRPVAGKTGTTNNNHDAWFAGYAPQLTTVVWVGFDQNVEMAPKAKKTSFLTGANSALPIWVEFMKKALETEPPAAFPLSADLADFPIDRHSGKLAISGCPTDQVIFEKYIKSQEPRQGGCEPSWPASVSEVHE